MITRVRTITRHATAGFSMVEAIIVAALAVLVFGALLGSYRYSLDLLSESRARLSGLSLATDRMEYFRSLPYNDIGTISGIPAGTIPQTSTLTLNNITFEERVLVEYVDDDADGKDGTGVPDGNGVPNDYKRIKTEYTWDHRGIANTLTLVGTAVPMSIETNVGGGSVRINVVDENLLPVHGAAVQLVNTSLSPAVDVTRYTDVSGKVIISGAPAGSDYEVIVNGTIGGEIYSTDQTYQISAANPNPSRPPFTVVEASVEAMVLQIGRLSDLSLTAVTNYTDTDTTTVFDSSFTPALGSGGIATGTRLTLAAVAGNYVSNGIAYIGPISPTTIAAWQAAQVLLNVPVNTTARWQFFTGPGDGTYTLVPEADLPGNSIGFSGQQVRLDGLSVAAYPSLYVGIALTTADSGVSPEVETLAVYYRESVTPLSNTGLTLQGAKTIGSTADLQPIYKYSESLTTNGAGEIFVPNLEFDSYIIASGYDVASACPAYPIVHQAGVPSQLTVALAANQAHTLRVVVQSAAALPVPAASVTLSRAGFNETVVTDGCGQAFFFGGVPEAADYDVTVTATGYSSYAESNISVSGDTVEVVSLP